MPAIRTLPVVDRRRRPLRDLRVSVTDRCNFRCRYCMPREVFGRDFVFLPKREILTFEEIARVARASVALGVQKLRLTGGEPLLRAGLPELVRLLSEIGADVALTTNGSLLEQHAEALSRAGLRRVTVSLDSLDPAVFQALSDTDVPLERVLRGIEAAERSGLRPIKINAVVRRGTNDSGLVDLAAYFKERGHIVRFIEFMDVGSTNRWTRDDVVSAAEIVDRISAVMPLEPMEPNYEGEVARRWRYRDGKGEIGVIASVTRPFCGDCTRARLSADGHLYTCLFATRGTDLRAILRGGSDDVALVASLTDVWQAREDRYSEQRAALAGTVAEKIEMSFIGG